MTAVKKPLVLLPGFLCDRTVWDFQISALADVAECTVLDWGTLGSIEAMAEHALNAAPERFALAGHSMGGRVAFQVYRMAPDRVERIALLNTGADARPTGEAGAEEERKRRALLALARSQGMRAMTLEWLRRNDSVLDRHLRTYLFTSSPIVGIEATSEGNGPSGGAGAGGGSLGIGDLRR